MEKDIYLRVNNEEETSPFPAGRYLYGRAFSLSDAVSRDAASPGTLFVCTDQPMGQSSQENRP